MRFVLGRVPFVFLLLVFKQVVDALCAHTAKTVAEQHVLRQREAGIDQKRIDRVIARHIPTLWFTSTAARVVLQSWVHGFVRQDPDQLSAAEGVNKLRIEVQRDPVRRHGGDRTPRPRAKTK